MPVRSLCQKFFRDALAPFAGTEPSGNPGEHSDVDVGLSC